MIEHASQSNRERGLPTFNYPHMNIRGLKACRVKWKCTEQALLAHPKWKSNFICRARMGLHFECLCSTAKLFLWPSYNRGCSSELDKYQGIYLRPSLQRSEDSSAPLGSVCLNMHIPNLLLGEEFAVSDAPQITTSNICAILKGKGQQQTSQKLA